MKIIEYPIPHEHGQEGFGFIYDRTTDTIHLTGGAFHWELMREAPVDMNRDAIFTGYVNQEYPDLPSVDTLRSSINGLDRLTTTEDQRITEALKDYLYKDPGYLNKTSKVSKIGSKVIEVETQYGFGGMGGEIRRPVVYIPDQDTMYVGSFDGSHASVIAEIDKRFRIDYPQGHGYIGDDRWEYYGY